MIGLQIAMISFCIKRKIVISFLQCAFLSVLGGLSSTGRVSNVHLDVLISMKSQLKNILVGFVFLHLFFLYACYNVLIFLVISS